jgi:hypothetical protein
MKITIKSTLADIAPEVYEAVNYETAKAIIQEHLKDSIIKDEDRKKMLDGVSKMNNLRQIQTYFSNSLLKYEGMSLNNNKE